MVGCLPIDPRLDPSTTKKPNYQPTNKTPEKNRTEHGRCRVEQGPACELGLLSLQCGVPWGLQGLQGVGFISFMCL